MANNAIIAFADQLQKEMPSLKLQLDQPMSALTTLRLGGPADLLAEPAEEDEVRRLLEMAQAESIPLTVIGRGSNLLVRDGGIRGLTLRLGPEMKNITLRGQDIDAGSGAALPALAAFAAENSLEGLAFAQGIPGSLGGAVYMNAGAYGGEMSQVVTAVSGFDYSGRPFWYTGKDMGFSYRSSRLQIEEKIVTAVTLSLLPGDREEIQREMNEHQAARAEKQPLNEASAGSTFRRPKGAYAAELIERCGLKGYTMGNVAVSEKHAGFLVNRGGTAAEFLALMAYVQQRVMEETGYFLEPEVRILGEDPA